MMLDDWKKDGGLRPEKREDGWPTRNDTQWATPAETAITNAMYAVEEAGGSVHLTDAVTLLATARNRVADHVEGRDESPRKTSGFHWRDGWFFERAPDGSVMMRNERWLGAGRFISIPAPEWASIVCSVSKDGETGERWNQAQDFHGRP